MIKTSAASLAEFSARLPKIVLFGAAALIQVALLTVMIIDRVQILRDGTEVTLQSRPLDPRDFLRGDYVVLGYDISQLPAGPLLGQPAGNHTVFVKLAPNRDGLLRGGLGTYRCGRSRKPRNPDTRPRRHRRQLRHKPT